MFFRLSRALIYIFLNDFTLDPPWTPHELSRNVHGGFGGGMSPLAKPIIYLLYLYQRSMKSLIKTDAIKPMINHSIHFLCLFVMQSQGLRRRF